MFFLTLRTMQKGTQQHAARRSCTASQGWRAASYQARSMVVECLEANGLVLPLPTANDLAAHPSSQGDCIAKRTEEGPS